MAARLPPPGRMCRGTLRSFRRSGEHPPEATYRLPSGPKTISGILRGRRCPAARRHRRSLPSCPGSGALQSASWLVHHVEAAIRAEGHLAWEVKATAPLRNEDTEECPGKAIEAKDVAVDRHVQGAIRTESHVGHAIWVLSQRDEDVDERTRGLVEAEHLGGTPHQQIRRAWRIREQDGHRRDGHTDERRKFPELHLALLSRPGGPVGPRWALCPVNGHADGAPAAPRPPSRVRPVSGVHAGDNSPAR